MFILRTPTRRPTSIEETVQRKEMRSSCHRFLFSQRSRSAPHSCSIPGEFSESDAAARSHTKIRNALLDRTCLRHNRHTDDEFHGRTNCWRHGSPWHHRHSSYRFDAHSRNVGNVDLFARQRTGAKALPHLQHGGLGSPGSSPTSSAS